jgi:DNA-binding transcriptional LysR family regulator
MTDRLVVVGRAGHPLAQVRSPGVDLLARYPWIVGQSGTPLRNQWRALFEKGPLPAAPIECGSVTVIREVLRDTDFLTLLSPDQVALEIAAGILATIGPPLPSSTRTIGITTRADWRPSAVQRQFLEMLASASRSGVPENQ